MDLKRQSEIWLWRPEGTGSDESTESASSDDAFQVETYRCHEVSILWGRISAGGYPTFISPLFDLRRHGSEPRPFVDFSSGLRHALGGPENHGSGFFSVWSTQGRFSSPQVVQHEAERFG